jgi:hypothetical protein
MPTVTLAYGIVFIIRITDMHAGHFTAIVALICRVVRVLMMPIFMGGVVIVYMLLMYLRIQIFIILDIYRGVYTCHTWKSMFCNMQVAI